MQPAYVCGFNSKKNLEDLDVTTEKLIFAIVIIHWAWVTVLWPVSTICHVEHVDLYLEKALNLILHIQVSYLTSCINVCSRTEPEKTKSQTSPTMPITWKSLQVQ